MFIQIPETCYMHSWEALQNSIVKHLKVDFKIMVYQQMR